MINTDKIKSSKEYNKSYLIITISVISVLSFITQTSFAQLDFGSNKKFTKADSLRGTLSELRSCYDVLMYDLDVKVDIDNKFISGSNTIKFLAVQDFQKLQIDLFANMKIEKIEFNNQELKYTRQFNAVFVEFPDTIKKESVRFLKIYYSGNPQSAKHPPWDGGFSWDKAPPGLPEGEENQRTSQTGGLMDSRSSPSGRSGGASSPWVGVSCQGTGASLWWPCKDHQSDEPNEMLIRITVPPGLKDVSNGRLKRKITLPDGWTKFEWYVSYPINNYDVTLNIAKYKSFSDFYFNPAFKDTLTLDYFVLPENYEKAKTQFAQVKLMMDCYYKYFGEYPFVHDGYKLVETPYLGMEHQSCIAYGNKYKNGYLGYDRSGTGYKFDYIIIHESAHEWWGNAITTNDLADMWIHEGFGTYAEALYIECLYGYDAYLEYINAEKKSVENLEPIIGKYGVNKEGSNDMYPKGALLLHTIRSIINNDTKFFEIIKGIQDTFQYQTINSSDIENYISKQSGFNFSDIFDIYLRESAIPKLSLILEPNPWDLKVSYRWSPTPTLPEGEGEPTHNPNNEGIERMQTPPLRGGREGLMPVKVTLKKNEFDFIYPTTEWKTIKLRDMRVIDFKVATDLFYIDKEIRVVDEEN